MPLQNRVDPFGDIVAVSARGTLMGNRGGCMHTHTKSLANRRWVNRNWIHCVLDFKQRHRRIMSPGRYTELFFLDEATALSAGHRPCFECRRKRATQFLEVFAAANNKHSRPYADDFDRIAHSARLNGRTKRTSQHSISDLPDGVFIAKDGRPLALRGRDLLAWSFSGYTQRQPRPFSGVVEVLTPEPFITILKAGYMPNFHPTADTCSALSN